MSYWAMKEQMQEIDKKKTEQNVLTDNDIIKALECCLSDEPMPCQQHCPFVERCRGGECLDTYAIDLFNRQKAEIERFRKADSENFAKWNELTERAINRYEDLFQTAKELFEVEE